MKQQGYGQNETKGRKDQQQRTQIISKTHQFYPMKIRNTFNKITKKI